MLFQHSSALLCLCPSFIFCFALMALQRGAFVFGHSGGAGSRCYTLTHRLDNEMAYNAKRECRPSSPPTPTSTLINIIKPNGVRCPALFVCQGKLAQDSVSCKCPALACAVLRMLVCQRKLAQDSASCKCPALSCAVLRKPRGTTTDARANSFTRMLQIGNAVMFIDVFCCSVPISFDFRPKLFARACPCQGSSKSWTKISIP